MSEPTIITTHVYPPIPIRDFDWQAVTDDFEAEMIESRWHTTHPIGHGRTEAAAIADLREQLAEREEAEGAR